MTFPAARTRQLLKELRAERRSLEGRRARRAKASAGLPEPGGRRAMKELRAPKARRSSPAARTDDLARRSNLQRSTPPPSSTPLATPADQTPFTRCIQTLGAHCRGRGGARSEERGGSGRKAQRVPHTPPPPRPFRPRRAPLPSSTAHSAAQRSRERGPTERGGAGKRPRDAERERRAPARKGFPGSFEQGPKLVAGRTFEAQGSGGLGKRPGLPLALYFRARRKGLKRGLRGTLVTPRDLPAGQASPRPSRRARKDTSARTHPLVRRRAAARHRETHTTPRETAHGAVYVTRGGPEQVFAASRTRDTEEPPSLALRNSPGLGHIASARRRPQRSTRRAGARSEVRLFPG